MTILTITALINIIVFISTVSSYMEVVPMIELTDATYSKLVESEHIWLIMFYAPWCHHCKKIRPSIEELPALRLSHKIRYGLIDATVHTDSATK